MAGEDKKMTIVIDCGSYEVKAGIAGDSAPKATFSGLTSSNIQKETFKRIFEDELGVVSRGVRVLMTDHLTSTIEYRKNIADILFKNFEVSHLFFAHDSVLSLYAKGRQDGVVVDMGHQHTYVVPVIKGYAVKEAIQTSQVNGQFLDEFLATGLKERGHKHLSARTKYVRKMKETVCSIASDKSTVNVIVGKLSAVPPTDKSMETVFYEWSKCGEPIFTPSIADLDESGLHKLIEQAINCCEESTRAHLWKNIFVTGGVTQFPGFTERLQIEISKVEASAKVIYGLPTEATWIGGSILSSLPLMDSMFVSREQYEKIGSDSLSDAHLLKR